MENNLKYEKNILQKLSNIYVFIIILIFPLMIDSSKYFNILQFKWYFFVITSTIYISAVIFIILYFLIFEKTNYLKKLKFNIIHILAIIFLIINILSYTFSPYLKDNNLLVGVGRGEGLIVISLYIFSFLFLTLFAKFQRKYLLYFSISSILLNSVAILQYAGLNPFHLITNSMGVLNTYFISTIGNVDVLSAVLCILIPISLFSFIFLCDAKIIEKIIHLLSVILGFFVLYKIDVDSGKVGIFITLILIIPLVIIENKKLSKFLFSIGIMLLSIGISSVLNSIYNYNLRGMELVFKLNNKFIYYLIISIILIILSFIIKKIQYNQSNNKKIIKKLYLSIFILFGLGLIFIYFYEFEDGILYEFRELLHGNFDDQFGTYRIFLWKRTLKIVNEYPIIGSGPDTFALRFMPHYTKDIMQIGELTINDTAANVYLTMLINIGIVGLGSYLTFLYFQIKNGIKSMNEISIIFLFTIICFLVQDFFNLWVVLVTPMFWTLMAIHFISIKRDY